MLTEHEVRDLLRLAGDTVEVGPTAAPRPVRRRTWPVVAAAVAVAAAIAVVLALSGLPGADRDAVDPGPVAPPTSPSAGPTTPPGDSADGTGARAAAVALLGYLRGGEPPRTAEVVDLRWSFDDYTSGPGLPAASDDAWPGSLLARSTVRVVDTAACLDRSPRPDLGLVAAARITVPRDARDCSAPALHVWVDAAGRIRLVDLAPEEQPPAGEPVDVPPPHGLAAKDFVDWVQGDYAKGTFPFAESPVELLLSGRRVGTTDALGPDAWLFPCEGGYAGRDCPVFLDPHMFEQGLEFEVGVADLLCAPTMLDLPPRLRDTKAVSITPAVSDCTTGYGVTLWTDDDGRIFAVNLQLAEP